MMKMICRLIGHDFSIVGLTGKYKWCKRCAKRIDCHQQQARPNDERKPIATCSLSD